MTIEHATNSPVGVAHVWPYSKLVNPEAQPFSSEREADVWDELRNLTFDDDLRGNIAVATHSDNGDAFLTQLKKDDVVISRVKFFSSREVEREIHHPATEAYTFQRLRSVNEAFEKTASGRWEEVPDYSSPIEVPAEAAHTETRKEEIPFHLGSKLDAETLIKHHRDHEISALILWYPESAHLKYLSKVVKACPELPIYVFHCEYRTDSWGVEREGCTNGSLWDTQSDLMEDRELQAVIEHVANQGESTWIFGPPKQGKTFIMLCIVKALLTGEALFGVERLRVPHQSKRVIYLCPEAGRSSLRKRLKMLGLVEYLYDPVTNPDGKLYLRSLSKGPKLNLESPELLELAKGADIFIDTAIRYVEGDENNATDVKQMTEKILNLLAAGARSMWVAHHSGKSFASATEITLENCARGSTAFAASLTNAIGIVQLDKDKNLIHFHFIDGRDMDEPATDMHLQGRPYLNQIGNFQVTENVERFKGRNNKVGPKSNPDKQAKIDFAKSAPGSLQDKADAVNEKFASKHSKSTVSGWLKEFDSNQEVKA